MLYMYFSFALFNGIRFRNIFKKQSYQGISALRITGAVMTGFALSITLVGLMFKIMSWPGAAVNLGVGLAGLIIAAIIGGVKYALSSATYYIRIFKRIGLYGAIGTLLFFLPKDYWITAKYRNYPEYVEAYKKATASPDNKELWQELDEERKKIHQK
jgi:hypothetical protein